MLRVLDVKLGRGGDANSHIGNIKFRQLISQYKPRYIAASRSNKPFVAEEVVQIWRNLDPPGRFLIRTDPSLGDDSTWHDVGDRRARKKASQALREKDRSDDLVASLAHHGQIGIPGMAAMPPSLAPTVAQVQVGGGNAGGNNMVAAAAAAMAAAANEQSRKRAREQQEVASFLAGDRRVAQRQDGGPQALDPVAAARALQQLLQPQVSSLAAPAPPAPVPEAAPAPPAVAQAPPVDAPAPVQAPAPGSSLDSLLLPALQLLLQQKQQEQQQQQQQQTLSNLASVLQSLVANQSNQAQQPSAGRSPPADQLATALSSLLGSSAPNQPTSAAPGPVNPGPSQPSAAPSVPNLFAQAAQFASPSAVSGAVPNLFAQAPSSQFVPPAQNQQGAAGQSQGQNLDRLLATRIIENLINSNSTQQRNGL